MAFNAFDTYAELISRGKARAEKSGEVDLDLDDDETALRTAAEAIRVACRYGSEAAADRVLKISETLGRWMSKVSSNDIVNSDGDDNTTSQRMNGTHPQTRLSPETAAIAYRALGIAQAHYARSTYDPTVRKEMQQKAFDNFTQALSQGLPDAQCTESLYGLALLTAERRDISGGIKLAKRALANPQETQSLAAADGVLHDEEIEEAEDEDISFAKQRKLLPVFHLLALLLCAREDYQLAAATCEAAFDQFGSALNDMMSRESAPSVPESTIGRRRKPRTADPSTLADMMDSFEKHAMLEIKMTQLALTELLDGAEAAVNATSGLFALYAALFGNINADVAHLRPSKSTYSLPPPTKPSTGTVRSIMSRTKANKSLTNQNGYMTSLPNTSAVFATRPGTSTAHADSMSIRTSQDKHNLATQQTPSRSSSLRKKVGSLRHPHHSVETIQEKEPLESAPAIESGIPAIGHAQNASSPIRPIAHNMAMGSEPQPAGKHGQQPPAQDTRLPVPLPHSPPGPPPQFVITQARRLKMSLLIQVWLFVATLYINAGVFDDANDAIEEANKLNSALELEVSANGCSVKNFQDRGWASGASVEELWADVHSQVCHCIQVMKTIS